MMFSFPLSITFTERNSGTSRKSIDNPIKIVFLRGGLHNSMLNIDCRQSAISYNQIFTLTDLSKNSLSRAFFLILRRS